jgi:hypothetical protein
MITRMKMMIYKTFLYDIIRPIKHNIHLCMWNYHGKPVPSPSLVKQRIVIEYGKRFRLRTLIETGTCLGDMVYATRNTFTRIFSIELNKNLYEMAVCRFGKFDHISFECGDSSAGLASLLADIHQPCLFWLDAHYSGGITQMGKTESPIIQELDLILRHQVAGHVVLVDDARNFIGQNSYPTLGALRDWVVALKPNWTVEVDNDIIRLHERPQG